MSREKVLQYSEERDKLEKEIKDLAEYLTAPGMPGIKGPLIDLEGFPLPGVDLYAIRQARQKFLCLNNDYTALMNKIEGELHAYYGNPSNAESVGKSHSMPIEVSLTTSDKPVAFAEISEVAQGSPASSAGFQVFDKIIKFGSVNYLNSNTLSGLQEFVKTSEGTEVPVVILRGSEIFRTIIKPAKWDGNGIIGCRFKPL